MSRKFNPNVKRAGDNLLADDQHGFAFTQVPWLGKLAIVSWVNVPPKNTALSGVDNTDLRAHKSLPF